MDFYLQYGNYLSNILQSLIKNKKPAQPDFKLIGASFFTFVCIIRLQIWCIFQLKILMYQKKF